MGRTSVGWRDEWSPGWRDESRCFEWGKQYLPLEMKSKAEKDEELEVG